MTYKSIFLPVYFPLCQELSQQNRGGLIFLYLRISLATSCCWKISNTDWLSTISGIHQPYTENGVSLARITQDFVWDQKLASSCSEGKKTRLYTLWVWDFAKAHTTARILIIQWWKEAPQKHRYFCTPSLWNLAWASTKLKLPVTTPTKIKLSINPSTKQVWSSASHDTLQKISINKLTLNNKSCFFNHFEEVS